MDEHSDSLVSTGKSQRENMTANLRVVDEINRRDGRAMALLRLDRGSLITLSTVVAQSFTMANGAMGLGLVRTESANRAIIAETIVFLFGGILGTLHHLYFTGTPTSVIAVGSVFSALEVVPLTLIGLEALQTYQRSKAAPWLAAYKWPVMCFVAVGFWNTVGAGLLGFAINPPASDACRFIASKSCRIPPSLLRSVRTLRQTSAGNRIYFRLKSIVRPPSFGICHAPTVGFTEISQRDAKPPDQEMESAR